MRKNGKNIECVQCGKLFYVPKVRFATARYCSYRCVGKSREGKPITGEHLKNMLKGMEGRIVPSLFKVGHKPWHKDVPLKGEQASYSAIHWWVRKRKPRPPVCEMCGEKRRMHWANIDFEYRRDLEDYVSLCSPCHGSFDRDMHAMGFTRRKM